MELEIDYTALYDLWNFFAGKYCPECDSELIEAGYDDRTYCPNGCRWKQKIDL